MSLRGTYLHYYYLPFLVVLAAPAIASGDLSPSTIPILQSSCSGQLKPAKTESFVLDVARIKADFTEEEVKALAHLSEESAEDIGRLSLTYGNRTALNLALRAVYLSWETPVEVTARKLRASAEALAEAIARQSSVSVRKAMAAQIYANIRDLIVADPNEWESNPGINPILHALLGLRVREVMAGERPYRFRPDQRTSQRFPGENTYLADDPELLLSPAALIDEVIRTVNPKPGDLWIDIGSGLGNFGFSIGLNHPDQRFIGFEIVPERVREAKRVAHELELDNRIEFEESNVGDDGFQLPLADNIYLFNALSESTTRRVFRALKELAQRKSFALVVESDLNYPGEIHWPGRIAKTQTWLKARTLPATLAFEVFDATPPASVLPPR